MKSIYIIITTLALLMVLVTGCTTKADVQSDITKPDISPEIITDAIIKANDGDSIDLSIDKITKIINGEEVSMLGYNGQVPGPLLHVKQGAQITVNVTNNLDTDTTVHWHGLRLDNKFDGVPGETMDTQMPGESFEYTLDFTDEGIYWYHPHVREDMQQELGLYGNMLVDSKYNNYYNSVNKEIPLIVDDILIQNGDIAPFKDNEISHALMGRFGNVMLTNGDENYTTIVQKGDVVRFYVTNVANTRMMNVSIPGVQLKLVGGDIGSYEKEEYVDSIIISPAERYTIEAYFLNEGDFKLVNINPENEYELGTIIVEQTTASNDYSGEFLSLQENEYVQADIAEFKQYFSKDVDVQIDLSIQTSMNLMMDDEEHDSDNSMETNDSVGSPMMNDDTEKTGGSMMKDESTSMNKESDDMMDKPMKMDSTSDEHGIEWEDEMMQMNTMSNNNTLTWILRDNASSKENMDIDLNFKIGEKVKIRLYNDPNSAHPMQHPIHFHGQRFLVLEKDGVKTDNFVWKDTVLVPVGSSIDILLDVTNPGNWMAHCHIAEHLQSGMMMSFEVTV